MNVCCSYCRITGKSRNLPKPHYPPLIPMPKPNIEELRRKYCRITGHKSDSHSYVPNIEHDSKIPRARICRIMHKSHSMENHSYIPMFEDVAFSHLENCRITQHYARSGYNFLYPLIASEDRKKLTEIELSQLQCCITHSHHINSNYKYSRLIMDDPDKQMIFKELHEKVIKNPHCHLNDEYSYVYPVLNEDCSVIVSSELEEILQSPEIEGMMMSKKGDEMIIVTREGESFSFRMEMLTAEEVHEEIANAKLMPGCGAGGNFLTQNAEEKFFFKPKPKMRKHYTLDLSELQHSILKQEPTINLALSEKNTHAGGCCEKSKAIKYNSSVSYLPEEILLHMSDEELESIAAELLTMFVQNEGWLLIQSKLLNDNKSQKNLNKKKPKLPCKRKIKNGESRQEPSLKSNCDKKRGKLTKEKAVCEENDSDCNTLALNNMTDTVMHNNELQMDMSNNAKIKSDQKINESTFNNTEIFSLVDSLMNSEKSLINLITSLGTANWCALNDKRELHFLESKEIKEVLLELVTCVIPKNELVALAEEKLSNGKLLERIQINGAHIRDAIIQSIISNKSENLKSANSVKSEKKSSEKLLENINTNGINDDHVHKMLINFVDNLITSVVINEPLFQSGNDLIHSASPELVHLFEKTVVPENFSKSGNILQKKELKASMANASSNQEVNQTDTSSSLTSEKNVNGIIPFTPSHHHMSEKIHLENARVILADLMQQLTMVATDNSAIDSVQNLALQLAPIQTILTQASVNDTNSYQEIFQNLVQVLSSSIAPLASNAAEERASLSWQIQNEDNSQINLIQLVQEHLVSLDNCLSEALKQQNQENKLLSISANINSNMDEIASSPEEKFSSVTNSVLQKQDGHTTIPVTSVKEIPKLQHATQGSGLTFIGGPDWDEIRAAQEGFDFSLFETVDERSTESKMAQSSVKIDSTDSSSTSISPKLVFKCIPGQIAIPVLNESVMDEAELQPELITKQIEEKYDAEISTESRSLKVHKNKAALRTSPVMISSKPVLLEKGIEFIPSHLTEISENKPLPCIHPDDLTELNFFNIPEEEIILQPDKDIEMDIKIEELDKHFSEQLLSSNFAESAKLIKEVPTFSVPIGHILTKKGPQTVTVQQIETKNGQRILPLEQIQTKDGPHMVAVGQIHTPDGPKGVALGQIQTPDGPKIVALGQIRTPHGLKLVALGHIESDELQLLALQQMHTDEGTHVVAVQQVRFHELSGVVDFVSDGKKLETINMSHVNTEGGSALVNIGQIQTNNGSKALALGQMETSSGPKIITVGQIETKNGLKTVAIGQILTDSGLHNMALGQIQTKDGPRMVGLGQIQTPEGPKLVALAQIQTNQGLKMMAIGQIQTADGLKLIALSHVQTKDGLKMVAVKEISPSELPQIADYSKNLENFSSSNGKTQEQSQIIKLEEEYSLMYKTNVGNPEVKQSIHSNPKSSGNPNAEENPHLGSEHQEMFAVLTQLLGAQAPQEGVQLAIEQDDSSKNTLVIGQFVDTDDGVKFALGRVEQTGEGLTFEIVHSDEEAMLSATSVIPLQVVDVGDRRKVVLAKLNLSGSVMQTESFSVKQKIQFSSSEIMTSYEEEMEQSMYAEETLQLSSSFEKGGKKRSFKKNSQGKKSVSIESEPPSMKKYRSTFTRKGSIPSGGLLSSSVNELFTEYDASVMEKKVLLTEETIAILSFAIYQAASKGEVNLAESLKHETESKILKEKSQNQFEKVLEQKGIKETDSKVSTENRDSEIGFKIQKSHRLNFSETSLHDPDFNESINVNCVIDNELDINCMHEEQQCTHNFEKRNSLIMHSELENIPLIEINDNVEGEIIIEFHLPEIKQNIKLQNNSSEILSKQNKIRGVVLPPPPEPDNLVFDLYVAIADYIPDGSDSEAIPVLEGQIVEVLDSHSSQKWLVRTRPSKTSSSKQGWVPPSYLEKKTLSSTLRNIQEILEMESDSSSDGRIREATRKRSLIVKELVETEEEFAKDMVHVVNTYLRDLENPRVPKEIRDLRDSIFMNFKQICDFHNNVLIKGVQYYANEPVKLGKTFLRLERDFDMHVNYCRDEPQAQIILANSPAKEYFEQYSQRIGEIDKTLSDHLKLPIQRINDYQLLLKELIKYSARLKEDCVDLQKALDFMLSIPQRAHDLKFINSIEGYKGNLLKLGRLLRHDWFTITDNEGKSKERYLFLFKSRILITKVRRISEERSVFILKDIIRLPDTEIKDISGDKYKFELHHKQKEFPRYPLTLAAKTEFIKEAWLKEIREFGIADSVDLGIEEIEVSPSAEEIDVCEEPKLVTDTGTVHSESLTSMEADDSVALECEVFGLPPATVTWLKNNLPLTESDRLQLIVKSSQHHLNRKGVDAGDTGLYSVNTNISTGSSSTTVHVKSLEVPTEDQRPSTPGGTILPHPPIFAIKFKDTEIIEGSCVTFMLKIHALPDAEIKFYKDDKEIQFDDRVKLIVEDKETFELVIINVVPEDAGKYRCTAKNSEGEASEEANVTISADRKVFIGIDSPAKTPSPIPLQPGESPDFKWYRDGQEFEASERFKVMFKDEEDTLALVFQHVKPEDAGLYTCVASTASGNISCSAELTVQGAVNQLLREPEAPKITAELSDTEVSAGGSAMLELKFSGYPKPAISWVKDKTEIQAGGRFRFLHEDDESIALIIKNVAAEDSGKYKVTIKNELGEVTTSADLIVKAPPKFKKQMKDLSVMADEIVKLEVEIEGKPTPEVTWYKDGQAISASSRIEIRHEKEETYSLTIKKVASDDSGSYSCVASNSSGKISEFSNLSVNVPPTFLKEIKSVECKETDTVKFEVKVAGTPIPKVTWTKNDEEIKPDGKRIKIEQDDRNYSLTIEKVTRAETGKYSCKIANEHGSASSSGDLFVNCIPEFTQRLSDKTFKEGDENVQLEVKLSGTPTPKIKWFIESMEITEKSNNYQIKNEGETQVLIIKKVTPDCSGKLTCQATNNIGDVKTAAVISVLTKPKFVQSLSDQEVNEGDKVTFTVKLSGNPGPEIKWLKDNKDLTVDAHIKFTHESSETWSVTFDCVSAANAGEYECQATNSEGQASSKSKLVVNRKLDLDIEDSEKNEEVKMNGIEPSASLDLIRKFDKTFEEDETSLNLLLNGQDHQTNNVTELASIEKITKVSTIKSDDFEKHEMITEIHSQIIIQKAEIYSESNQDENKENKNDQCQSEENNESNITKNDNIEENEENEKSFDKKKDKWWLEEEETIVTKCIEEVVAQVEKEIIEEDIEIPDMKLDVPVFHPEDEYIVQTPSTAEIGEHHPFPLEQTIKTDVQSLQITEMSNEILEVVIEETNEDKNNEEPIEDMTHLIPLTSEANDIKETQSHEDSEKELAENKDNVIDSQEIKDQNDIIDDGAKPKFEKGLSDLNAWLGLEADIEVKVQGIPEPEVKWFKNNEVLSTSEKLKFEKIEKTHRIIIKETVVEDGATYKCTIKNKIGEATTECTLKIKTPEDAKEPVCIKQLKDTITVIQEPSVFQAKILGNPKPEIKWMKDGVELAEGGLIHITEKQEEYLYCLTVEKSVPEDMGVYKIHASNEHGQTSSEANLDVHVPPEIIPPMDRKIMPKGKATFETTVTGRPQPKVSWHKNGKELTEGPLFQWKADDAKNLYTLTIDGADLHDAGEYECVAENVVGKAKQPFNLLITTEEPSFTKPLQSASIKPTTKAQFDVEVAGIPMPGVKWLRGGVELSPNFKTQIIQNSETSHSLKIDPFTEEDAGEYECKAISAAGEVSSKARLDVKHELPFFPKHVPKETCAIDGESFTLEAKVDGSPHPKVKWLKDGKELVPGDRIKMEALPDGTVRLTVNNAKNTDTGKYTLVATNESGEVSSAGLVQVEAVPKAPSIPEKLQKTEVFVGSPLVLKARVTGYPKPLIKWLKDGKPIKADRVKLAEQADGCVALIIDEARPDDAGKYTLIVKNNLGETSSEADVTVNSAPSYPGFHIKLKHTDVYEGYPITLEGKIIGYPLPTLQWLKDGQEIKPDGQRIIASLKPDGSFSLVVNDSTPQDAGKYTCVATNSEGTEKSEAEVGVKSRTKPGEPLCAPSFITPLRDTGIDEGLPLKLQAHIAGNPVPSISWFKDGEPLKSSDRTHILFDGDRVSLDIKNVTPVDAGKYECKLTSSEGTVSSVADVKIKKVSKPPIFTQRFPDSVVILAQDARFVCRVTGIPTPDITWYFNNTPLAESDKYKMKHEGDMYALYVKDCTTKDIGNVNCIARNIDGEENCIAFLNVVDKLDQKPKTEAPSFLKKLADCEIIEGMTAKFTACISGYPEPDFKWFKDGHELTQSERIHFEVEPHGLLRLLIKNVRADDVGKYSLKISNPHGVAESEASLNYEGYERKPKKPMADLNIEYEKVKKTGVPFALPDKPIISKMTDRRLTLSWKPSIPVGPRLPVSYIVEMCEVPDDNWYSSRAGVRGCCCEIRNLEPFRDYKFRIRVENKYGISDPSPYATAYRTKLEMSPPKYLPTLPAEFDFRPETSPYFPKDYDIEKPPHEAYAHAPRFLRQETDTQYGVRNQPSSIQWFVYGYPVPTISWYFEDEKIEVLNRYSSSFSRNGQATLYINRFLERDIGIYECVAVNEHGEARQRIVMNIAEPPVFSKQLDEVTVMIRDTACFECRVVGTPYPQIKWYKDWHPLASSNRIKIEWKEPDLCILTIHDTITKDAGLYSCSACNLAGMTSNSVMLTIEENEDDYAILSYSHSRVVKARHKPFEDFYDIGDELGRGTQGIIYHAVERATGNSYAGKIMHGKGDFRDAMNHELNIMNQLHDRHLIRGVDCFETKQGMTLITELSSGGELFDSLCKQSTLSEDEVAMYIRQVLWGLEHMHNKGIAHLGLTPGDLLLAKPGGDDIKICDFGLAQRILRDKALFLDYGMPEFVAPEIANKQPVALSADMWSVGVITYLLLSGISPFLGEHDRQTLQQVQQGRINFDPEVFSIISDDAKDFISKLLVFDPSSRLDVKQALKHPWLKWADRPGSGERFSTDRLKNYYRKYKDWVSNSACRRFYRRRPLSSAFTHPSRMVYPPDEQYTPPSSPEMSPTVRSKPPPWDMPKFEDKVDREQIDYDLGYIDSESRYQSGPDTYLLQLRDVGLPLRLREYMRVSASHSPTLGVRLLDTLLGKSVTIRERRRFTDVMDEEIDDEKKGSTDASSTQRRIISEVSPRSETKNRIKELIPAKAEDGSVPFFREKLHDESFVEDQEVELSCFAVGDPKPTVQWYRNDVILQKTHRLTFEETPEGRSILHFSSTKAFDAGLYKAIARNANGDAVCRARLRLGDVPGRMDAPEIGKTSDSEAFVTWVAPKDTGNTTIESYELEYKDAVSSEWLTAHKEIPHEFFMIRGLKPTTQYQCRIRAKNKFGIGEFSVPSSAVRTLEEGSEKVTISKAMKHQQELTESGTVGEYRPRGGLDYSIEDNPINVTGGSPTDKYNFVSEIARGQFSVIVKCCQQGGDRVFAAKIINSSADNIEQARHEFEIMKTLCHEQLPCLYEAFSHNGTQVLIMEKLQGYNVLTYLTHRHEYSEEMVTRIISQILNAVQYLHFRSLVHLDIQPDNVVMKDLQSKEIKLVDFGSARKLPRSGSTFLSDKPGSLDFRAPEVVSNEEVSFQADIWSIGVLAYILLSGTSPFAGNDDKETAENINFVRYRFENLYKEITPESTRFLLQIFKRTPSKRPIADECLEHKWLNPSEYMLKKRERAIFLSSRLKQYADVYDRRKQELSKSSESLVASLGIQLGRSISVECDASTTF